MSLLPGEPGQSASSLPGAAPSPGAPDPRPQSAAAGPAAPPTLALKKGGGAIRGIGETFAAMPATGTASITVPIPTSPGRRGFGPDLSFRYDSGSGDGPCGRGWTVSVPSISLRTDQGLPRYLPDPEDVAILSGTEPLVPALDEVDGRLVRNPIVRRVANRDYVVQEYRPRTEAQFARIERWGAANGADVHWRTITRDNITSLYGTSPASRVADPLDGRRIFSWLLCESYDDVGNAIVYEYKAEDDARVNLIAAHERGRDPASRTVNRYLKRIRYGNRVSRLIEPDLAGADWLFEVVFDYGEHDAEAPTPHDAAPWLCRADPFSTFRPGFEVRTYRLLQRVLIFHHFPEQANVGEDCLVRSTDVTYRSDNRRGEAAGSFLATITQHGYRRHADGSYRRASMAPLECGYSTRAVDDRVRALDGQSSENIPVGVDQPTYRLVDLDGEGVRGILVERGGAWSFKDNLGDGRFGPSRVLRSLPASARAQGRVQLIDLDGDGRLEAVTLAGPDAGFYERDDDGGWRPFTPFAQRPNLPLDSPRVRLLDLTGDGLVDALVEQEDGVAWYAGSGDGFALGGRVLDTTAERRPPRLVRSTASQVVYLADMTGDGLQDWVRVRNGEVCYWPNRGYGRFGPKVVMDDAPWFDEPDQFDAGRLRLADIDDTGSADVVYLHRDGVRIYFNLSGNSLAGAEVLPHSLPFADTLGDVAVADLLGRGTACLVWSSRAPGAAHPTLNYIDLMAGGKPHLLVSTRNNLGRETRMRYAPSTLFSLADKAAGRPWLTRMPFAVHVLERVETLDRITGNEFVSRYAYRDGYFDPIERSFNGFGLVEQYDAETIGPTDPGVDPSTHLPPVLTRTWFHTGAPDDHGRVSRAYAEQYYGGDPGLELADTVLPTELRRRGRTPIPWQLSASEAREAQRALKGSVLRQEVYGLDGTEAQDRPYLTSERNYTVELLQPKDDEPHAVLFVHPRETITAVYERARAPGHAGVSLDPRIAHEVVLEVDDYGNVRRSANLAYGRRQYAADPVMTPADHARQARDYVTLTEHGYTNPVDLPDSFRAPQPAQTRAWELRGLRRSERLVGFQALREALAGSVDEIPVGRWEPDEQPRPRPARRLVTHERRDYRRDDLQGGLPSGVLESRALPERTYRLVFTRDLLDAVHGDRVTPAMLLDAGYVETSEGWWAPSGEVFYSPDESDAPVAEREFAERHFFTPVRFREPFGSSTIARYDPYDLSLLETRDALGNTVTAGERRSDGSLIRTGIDYRVLQPRLVSDANRNRTAVAFDALGMVVGTASMGKPEESLGQSLDEFDADLQDETVAAYLADPETGGQALLGDASTRLIYDQLAYLHTRDSPHPQPVVVANIVRETHRHDLEPGQSTRIHQSFAYSDGLGRELQKKERAEPAKASPDEPARPRWVAGGWTVLNNKGRPVRTYEPFFSATHRFESDVVTGVATTLCYDPVERVVATLHPNDTWAKVVFHPWGQATWDTNDTVLRDPRSDEQAGPCARPYLGEDWVSWYSQRIGGALGPHEQVAAEKAAGHAGTPARQFADALGRTYLSVAHNRFVRAGAPIDEHYATRTEHDIEGNEREVVDALGRLVVRKAYDLLGARASTASMEAGWHAVLVDVLGKPVRTWNSGGISTRIEHDPLRRPVAVYVTENGQEARREGTTYGDSAPDAEARNLRTRILRQFDGSGLSESVAYDFEGNLAHASHRLVRGTDAPDWSTEVELESRVYDGRTSFDALRRPTEIVTPDGTVIWPGYNEAGLVERVDGTLRDPGGETTFVSNVDYDPRGRKSRIDYGNGVVTAHSYDPLSFRLVRLHTRRGNDTLQDLRYSYDPSGNVIELTDRAQQTLFFRNRWASPTALYTYDAVYRLISATGREHRGQGAGGGIGASLEEALRRALPHPSDGAALSRYTERYAHDPVGNLLTVAHRSADPAGSGWRRSYRYEEISALEHDAVNNRLTATATSGGVLQTFGYDDRGNTVSMPNLPTLGWDHADRLTTTVRERRAAGRPETTHYAYDVNGNRVRRVVERAGRHDSHPSRRLELISLGSFEVYREYGRDGTVRLERQTVHVQDDTTPVALVETRTRGTDKGPRQLQRYQLADHLGSVRIEVDGRARIISYEEFRPYGTSAYRAQRRTIPSPKRYGFTGRELDSRTGLACHGARYYVPGLGRWISCDPAGLADGPDTYVYARGSPTRYVDATGRSGIPWTDADIEQAISGLEETVKATGKGLREAIAKLNIDEIKAVARGGSWDDPANKSFLESLTNQATKGARASTQVSVPRPPISLADAALEGEEAFRKAAGEMLTRTFSEVRELDAITREARAAMTSLNRTPRQLATAINGAIRGRIATAATAETQLVSRALRVMGMDPATLTQVAESAGGAGTAAQAEQAVAATASQAGAAAEGTQAVTALAETGAAVSRFSKIAAPVLRAVAPVARVVGRVAGPVAIVATAAQVATAHTTAEKADAALSVASTGLFLAGGAVGATAGGAIVAGGYVASKVEPLVSQATGSRAAGVGAGTLAGAASGAAIGAVVGSIVPGVGTAVGAAVGGIAGGVAGFVRSYWN
jgi:RHS repeat-associated protein